MAPLIFVALISLSGCSGQGRYMRWMDRCLTPEEKAAYKPEFWERNVAKAIEVRDRMGWDIPEDIFKHFVLPVQTINRPVDNFRLVYADSLCRRIQGMDMWEAAREINYWCLERAVYGNGDFRSDSPLCTIERGHGTCNELTALYVSALRAAGIPARAANATWTHKKMSHQWTEMWIDGGWHFDCSCEPGEGIDANWLCTGITKVATVPVTVFGQYKGPEPVLSKDSFRTVIDNGARYSPRRLTSVNVVDGTGKPVKDATVEFKIFNCGSLATLYSTKTDRRGSASLATSSGDVVIWACKDGMFGLCKADKEHNTISMNHPLSEGGAAEFTLTTADGPLLPYPKTEEMVRTKERRCAHSDSLREARHALPPSDSLMNIYREEVLRAHLPEEPSGKSGNTVLAILSNDRLEYGVHFAISRILDDGSTEPVRSVYLDSGTYLLTCGTRSIARAIRVKATLVNIPKGASSVSIPLTLPTVADGDLNCLYTLPDTGWIDFGEDPWRMIALLPEYEESRIMSEWLEDINPKKCEKLELYALDAPSPDGVKAMEDMAGALRLSAPFAALADTEGNIWFTVEKWEKDTEWELTSIVNALEKRIQSE